MEKARKRWREKLADDKGLPKVVEINDKMSKRWGTGTCVILAPRQVNEIMNKVPRGKLTTTTEIRMMLAKKHGASIGCPLTTGIFLRIAAEAAEDVAKLFVEFSVPLGVSHFYCDGGDVLGCWTAYQDSREGAIQAWEELHEQ